ncbi:Uncharacterized protein dnl_10630 [Desulfonema limicola]|uniref:Uncharacterized protein n=1 Tax=Desulfonema limicola TaxID=45656 RepID=A0A975GF32_9BACT|nr:hypothetical protein [Desulfonema limicola]QTA78823.1 Uncharacterized protein dnl_10630 [Desulfonema limicola]
MTEKKQESKELKNRKKDETVRGTSRDREYYIKLAEEKNSRVIQVNTADTYILTDLARSSDQGIRRMRNQIMRTVEPEVFVDLMNRFNDAVISLSQAVEQICKTTDTPFKTPRGIIQILADRDNMKRSTSEKGKK